MKTYTITLHSTDNCGSSLQAYALQQFLSRNGIYNEIIDYVPDYIKYNGNKTRYLIKKILYCRILNKRIKRFDEFKKKYLVLSDRTFRTYKELCQAKLTADCFITGSDQLWNSMFACGQDPAFFLEFTSNPKISYAVSIGENDISERTLNNVKQYANGFQWVTLREKESVGPIKELLDCPVDYVCDPVVLNGIEIYEQIIDHRLFMEKYCVVYLAQSINAELVNELIKRIHDKLKCKIILIGSIIKHCDCDIHIKDAGPSQFLSLIKYADFVISNSFHATVFSVIYNRQFLVTMPKQNGIRIASFLKTVGLQERQITSIRDDYSEISEQKYSEVNIILNQIASESGEKLLSHLKLINAS